MPRPLPVPTIRLRGMPILILLENPLENLLEKLLENLIENLLENLPWITDQNLCAPLPRLAQSRPRQARL